MKDMDQAELQRILGDKKALRQIAGSADAQADRKSTRLNSSHP